jgi:hypothetical protein
LSNNALIPNGTVSGMSPGAISSNFVTLGALRLALPDGSEVAFQ